jgi:sulfur-oxidizing protein SoxY
MSRIGKLLSRTLVAGAALLLLGAPSLQAEDDDPWPDIRKALFQDRAIDDGASVVQVYGPEQAEDAAIVPIDIRFPAAAANNIKSVTLIIDRNPAPVAATFRFGDGFRAGPQLGERKLSTRVRVNSFSNVRAVAETNDGKLFMTAKFVMGAGGCSAPASKDVEAALANLGRMQIKVMKEPRFGESWREAVVMIRHPNFTGMQMDPISRGYTPAKFVERLDVKRGDDLVISMDGGIAISENPNIRFNFEATGSDELTVTARDSDGAEFKGRSTPAGS